MPGAGEWQTDCGTAGIGNRVDAGLGMGSKFDFLQYPLALVRLGIRWMIGYERGFDD
jgi:hypothetical protein